MSERRSHGYRRWSRAASRCEPRHPVRVCEPRPHPVPGVSRFARGRELFARRCRAAAAAHRRAPGSGQGRRPHPPVGHADPGILDRADRRPPLFYRGVDAATLAQSRSLEEVAALIWTGRAEAGAPVPALPVAVPRVGRFTARAQSMLIEAARRDRTAGDLRPAHVAVTGSRILRILTDAAAGRRGPGDGSCSHRARTRLGRQRRRHRGLARGSRALCRSRTERLIVHGTVCRVCWRTPLCRRHCGARRARRPEARRRRRARRVDARLAAAPARAARSTAARVRRGEPIDGFGHPLYPDGDPRARLLLGLLGERYPRSAEYRFVTECAAAAAAITGDQPNIDFALAAIGRVLKLPAGSPLMLFAVGRSVGWIGHALEQYATGQLIRPRARYVGAAPSRVGSEQ